MAPNNKPRLINNEREESKNVTTLSKLSTLVGDVAAIFLEQTKSTGNTIEIPSLGILMETTGTTTKIIHLKHKSA